MNARIAASVVQSTQSQASASSSLASSTGAAVPPWREDTTDRAALARKVLAGTAIVDPRADTSDSGRIYSAYEAIVRLRALASAVSNGDTSPVFLPQAQRKFAEGLDQLRAFLDTHALEKVIVLPSERLDAASTGIAISRASYRHVTPPVHIGSPDEAVPTFADVTGFGIEIKRTSDTVRVNIDLSSLAADQRSVRAVAEVIDTALDDAGVTTGIKAVKTGPPDSYGYPTGNAWGFAIEGVQSEKISFVVTGASGPGLYLAGVSGNGKNTAGQASFWRSLEQTAPTTAFINRDKADSGALGVIKTVVGNDGAVYTLARSDGALDGQSPRGDSDLVLIRSDSTGKRIWSRFLGSQGSVEGTALAVAEDGRVAIGGTVTGKLDASSIGGSRDGFVVIYDAHGRETLVRQRGVQGDDAVTALAFGAEGQLHIGGLTATPLDGSDGAGGSSDAYIETLDTDGSRVWIRHFGSVGHDSVTALTTDDSGGVIAATQEEGDIVLRRVADSQDDELDWSHALGPGRVTSVALDGSAVYVSGQSRSGTRTDGAFDPADSGLGDGFAVRIDLIREQATLPDAPEETAKGDDTQPGINVAKSPAESESGNVEQPDLPVGDLIPTGPVIPTEAWFHRIGGDGSQTASGIVVSDQRVYVAGTIPGDSSGSWKSYLKALNTADGSDIWQQTVSGSQDVSRVSDLALDPEGDSDLVLLGLPRGPVVLGDTERITDRTPARPGDHFFISVNGGSKTKIAIRHGDSYRDLTFRINAATVLDATAKVVTSAGQRRLTITPAASANIELFAGRDGRDALTVLGLPSGKVYGPPAVSGDVSSAAPEIIALELRFDADISDSGTVEMLDTALRRLRTAHRSATENPVLDQLTSAPDTSGPVPLWLQQQLSNYQAGLLRLQSINTGGSVPLSGLLI